jgi:hypothetical protein
MQEGPAGGLLVEGGCEEDRGLTIAQLILNKVFDPPDLT